MGRMISATELAKLGKCEQQLYFDNLYGADQRLTEKFIQRGNREHSLFESRLLGKKQNWFLRVWQCLCRWLGL